MFRQVSTLLVFAALSMLGACDDETVADAIPGKDAAADQASEAAKEASKGDATAAVDAVVDGSAPDSEADASDAPLE